LTEIGPKRHFAAAQQTVAYEGIATSHLSGATLERHHFSALLLIDAFTIAADNPSYRK
jgi:hypothetical protein